MRPFVIKPRGLNKTCRYGGTLVELAFVIVIVGIAVVAFFELLASSTKVNRQMSDYPIAMAITRAGHEWAAAQDFVELEAMFTRQGSGNSVTFLPYTPQNPNLLDARGQPVATLPMNQRVYAAWSHRFTMRKVQHNALTVTDGTGNSQAMEITVTAMKDGEPFASLSKLYFND